MNRLQRLSVTGFAVLALALLPGCFFRTTGPTEVGVRTVKFSLFGNAGVEPEPLKPGAMHVVLPFIHDWHTFDTRLQNLEMTGSGMRGDRRERDDLLFKTIDGNDISLDVIISYRIDPEQAPHILQYVGTTDQEVREDVVRTIARSKPRDIFGELNTEQFYIAETRAKQADKVVDELNSILKPYGIVVERVGTRDYRFNPAYQAAIEDKKVADQQAEKLKSETRAAEEEARTKVEKAVVEVEKVKTQADGEYRRAVIEADAYFAQQQRLAEAIEAEGRAEAEAILRMNEALSGAGGEAMVKLAIADALSNKRILMLPFGGGGLDLRTTDVNSLLELYGLRSLAAPPADGKASSGAK